MHRERLGKLTRHILARWGLKFCSLTVAFLPLRLIYVLAGLFGTLGYYLAGRKRRIAKDGLNIAFGKGLSPAQIRALIKDCFSSMASSGLEILYFSKRRELLRRYVKIEGEDNLDKAFSKGKGVVAVTAHFGNFPLMLTRFMQAGYAVSVVARRMRDSKVEEFFRQKRSSWNLNYIYKEPSKVCVRKCIESLRRGELLFIVMDQNFGAKGGIFVDFFSRQAATAPGAVVFALRTAAPIVPMFIIRERDYTHKIFIEPELTLLRGENQKDTISINVARLTKIIEGYVRQYPAQWGWIHRRWKTQR